MTKTETPTAAVLIIGNEILSGRTQDVNLNYIAKKLDSIGIRLAEARAVADIEADIVAAVNALRTRYDYLFTTGGIGGTHDDITADAVAKAFDLPVIENPQARARLEAHYSGTNNLNTARLRMARMPEGARLIDNPVSTAPGFHIENVYVLAGVPNIMQAMLDGIASTLKHGPTLHGTTILCHVPENTIAEELREIAAHYPQLEIGSYPWFRNGTYGTSLAIRGTDKQKVHEAADIIHALVAKHGGKPEIEKV